MEPKVTLLSHSLHPLETLYSVWEASRSNAPALKPSDLKQRRNFDPEFDAQVRKLFNDIIAAGIPVAENVDFVFLLENVSISLREQLVRHRIGVHVGDRVGMDIIPDLADSTWWSQSMRILDMGKFYEEGHFRIPESVKRQGEEAVSAFLGQIKSAEDTYNVLAKLGVPLEDAREVIPLGATHRLTWKLNLAALKHIVGKRGCWILQLGLWKPIVLGMIEALATQVDSAFRDLIAPPCIKGGKFSGCHFCLDNKRRIAGEDEIPPCPLYLHNHEAEALAFVREEETAGRKTTWFPTDVPGFTCADINKRERLKSMASEYRSLWNRDVHTGKSL